MGKAIVKIKDLYFEWSTVVDAPVTYGMTKEELFDFVKKEYGNEGLKELPTGLELIEETGTSFYYGNTIEELVSNNRAGKNEKRLSLDELYKKYTK
jgi:hypothetical protein